ncbi:UNVERIFIED_CONTAM: KIN14B-interacting protein [Sesamum calycinum]|uniref:KIN14B-interacting protein n=1 Tax=Sesamum calycinum TaxID=2727403 RepID=A0AAW2R9Q5_9LAMI
MFRLTLYVYIVLAPNPHIYICRISSSEAEGNDGVFCTPDSINVLDFRQPSGIGLKIPKVGVNVHSAFSRGDSIYIGCTSLSSATKKQSSAQIQHFSLRKQRLVSTYSLPESNAHHHFTALTQVWGNSNLVMEFVGLVYSFSTHGKTTLHLSQRILAPHKT